MATYDLTTGTSITNLLTYGDFENNGWTGTGSYDTAHVKYGTYARKMTGTTSAAEVVTYHSGGANLVQNHIYYCRMEVYHEGATGTVGFYFPEAEPSFQEGIDIGPANQWNICSGRNIRSDWSDNSTATFRIDYNNSNNATSVWIDGAMCIDLTACFGSGNEPTKEWCDKNIPFFTGTRKLYSGRFRTGDILNVPYSGASVSTILPKGTYKLECWGAQGGSYSTTYYGGKGGYSTGILTLTEDTLLILYTGQQNNTYGSSAGTTSGTAFNGGGYGTTSYYSSTYTYSLAGGGASDIRIGIDSLYARVIVAGGGSGSTNGSTGYAGGGVTSKGYSSTYQATQTAAGNLGSFGIGGNCVPTATNYKYVSAGGGGGWYGGGSYTGRSDKTSAYRTYHGGGSGYVYTESTSTNYPSGCLLNSAYYLTDASTIDGATSFTDNDGSTVTGHTGNGYIRITVIDIKTLNLRCKINNTWKSGVSMYVKVGGTWKLATMINSNIDKSWKG